MKRLIVATLMATMIPAAPALTGTYAKTAVVSEIDQTADVVRVETPSGIKYEFSGREDYELGDFVSLLMDDKGTVDIRDDEVLAATYAGYSMMDMIDMRNVLCIEDSGEGVLITTTDGGYYWER